MSGTGELRNGRSPDDRVVRGAPPADHGVGLTDPLLDAVRILDADGRVARDLRCLGCGYNLRTLREDGRCPECGQAVAESVRVYTSSPKDWLQLMADGADLVAGGFGLATGAIALAVPCIILQGWPGACAAILFGLFGAIMVPFGVIWLTARRADRLTEGKDSLARKSPLVCVALLVGSSIACLPVLALVHSISAFPVAAAVPPLMILVTLLALAPLLCLHLANIVQCIGRPDLARAARRALVAAVVFELLIGIDVVRLLASASFGAFFFSSPWPVVGLVAGLALLLMMIILLVRVARALRGRIAELTAASAPPADGPATPPLAPPSATRAP